MEYRQIVAVTGLSGLYQLMSTKNDGAIVRSLIDKSVKFVSARIHHITPLESIEIYTTSENVRLHEVLEKIKENDAAVADLNKKKDDKAAKAYFKTVLPDFDESRVYTSDIRKVLKWYELLKANDLLNFDYLKEMEAEATGEAPAATAEEAQEAEKPKKKAAAKKAAPAEGEEEKPAKKAAAKKKAAPAEGEEEKPAKKAAPKKKKSEEA
jgi:Tfp pilus assembly protein PilN